VGSLLRPAALMDARTKFENGQLGPDDYREIEDREVARIIELQQNAGLRLATDGELRRNWWHYDFLEHIDGVEGYDGADGIVFKGVVAPPRKLRIVGRLRWSGHPMVDHFRFLREQTKVTPKMTIPSPTVLHFRFGNEAIDASVYPDVDEFFHDLGVVYADAIADFYRAGCRYLQLDDTTWAFLCSDEQRKLVLDRGEDPLQLEELYAHTIAKALSGRPKDMMITTHLCRGNFKSTWISAGGYEPIAERVFGGLDYDGLFLEYDTERSGGFEVLRHVPRGSRRVVLGLVTSKSGELERKDQLKRRIDEAAKYVPIEQLCISPQCGFASTKEGNLLTEEDQVAKLRLVVEVAREVWGSA
jgi:5-methyltetrahydropteroyltriglutamate--homocysteine methyltransferase